MSTKRKKKSSTKSNRESTQQDSPRTKIIPMDWVDFHVFQWICHSEKFDVDKLVAEAVALAEANVESSIEQQLQTLLNKRVKGWIAEWYERVIDGMYWSADDFAPLVSPDSPIDHQVGYADLAVPLLKYGWDQISTGKVAEAILRYKGMWLK